MYFSPHMYTQLCLSWHALQIAQEYRVFFKRVEEVGQDYLVESSHNMYLLDPCLETVRCFGVEYEASDLAEAITTEGPTWPYQQSL